MTVRRSATSRSLVWLRDSATPMFVINAQRRVLLFNRGCEELSGWSAAEVLGQRVTATSVAETETSEALLTALMPPAEVWQGAAQQLEVWWPHKSESPGLRRVQFWPIRTETGAVQVVLGIVGEFTSTTANLALPASIAQSLHRELAGLRFELRRRFGEKRILGRCPAMLRVLDQVRLARQSAVPVWLRGEPGTGKDHLARTIHVGSPFGRSAFVALDGKFTPATEFKRVLRHLEDGPSRPEQDRELQPGTVYISQLEAVSGDVQERLLVVLKSHTAEPSVRFIVSTEASLDPMIAADRFSRELALRLSPLVIDLPVLRERGDDLDLLAQFFLEERNRHHEQQVSGFEATVLDQLRRYLWPGNLDELRKVIEEAADQCGEGIITVEHLPFRFRAGVDAQRQGPLRRPVRPLDSLLEQVEREELELAIAAAGGNLTQAAELLQIPRARLYRRLEQLGLRQPESSRERLESDNPPQEAAGE